MMMTDVTGRGGAEKAMVDLALRIDRSRYNVSVCATRSAGNYQSLLDAARMPTYIVGRQSRWEMHKMLGLVLHMRRKRVHVLHTHLFGANTGISACASKRTSTSPVAAASPRLSAAGIVRA